MIVEIVRDGAIAVERGSRADGVDRAAEGVLKIRRAEVEPFGWRGAVSSSWRANPCRRQGRRRARQRTCMTRARPASRRIFIIMLFFESTVLIDLIPRPEEP